MPYVPWELAWREALYGPRGFFRRTGSRHFRTAASSSVFGSAIGRLARGVDRALGEPADFTVVDVGAGRGELLELVATMAPSRWSLVGVEVADRPPHLSQRIGWIGSAPEDATGVVLAHELLDAVPCPVVEYDAAGDARLVLVDPRSGEERLGAHVGHPDAQWLARWWPFVEPGQRAEVGRPRDDAWLALTGSLRAGLTLAVDYAHSREDRIGEACLRGSLAAYRDGLRVPPVPDGSCDLTAHVALDACAAKTPEDTQLRRQRDVLSALGVSSVLPPTSDATVDAESYGLRLAASSQARVLLDAAGPGSFGWLLHARGLPLDELLPG